MEVTMNILHVDDNSDVLETVSTLIELHFGIATTTALSGNRAIELLKLKNNFSIVISDLNMPDGNGLHLFKFVNQYCKNSVFIFYTSATETIVLPPPNIFCITVEKLGTRSLIEKLSMFIDQKTDLAV